MAVTAAVAVGVLAVTVAGAAPALAMNPCNSDNPPDYCYDQPPPPPPAPVSPSNLVATSILQTSVTLQWTDRATTETSYVIQRVVYNQPTAVLTAPANSTSFTDTGAPAGRYIDYYVSARTCDSDTGLCSTSASIHLAVTTHPQPANPTWGGLTSYLWGSTYYWSGWTIDWDTTAPIQVAVIADGVVQSSGTAGGTATINVEHTGYGDNHGFSVQAIKSSVKGDHTLCLKAFNVGGGADVNLFCQPYNVAGPPSAATNLRLTNTGTSIVITFTDNANDEAGFWLQRSTDGGASWLSVGTQYAAVSGSGGTGTATDYSSPAPGTQYRILMVNSSGNTPSAAVIV
ncbi:MAG: hypothetical protein ACJ74U_04000 [Jatrophihabitantaceae bacterium]